MQTYQNQQGMNQQPAPMGLSDQELAYDLLYQEKALMANISSEVVEGSHAGLRNVLNDMFMQIGQDQLGFYLIIGDIRGKLTLGIDQQISHQQHHAEEYGKQRQECPRPGTHFPQGIKPDV